MFTAVLDSLLFFMVTIPVVGLVARKVGVRKILDGYAILGLILTSYYLYELYFEVLRNGIVIVKYSSVILTPTVSLEIDMFSVFMVFVYIGLALLVAIYSIRYMEHDTGLTWYYTLLFGLLISMVGATFAGDFFILFIFWQFLCITVTSLVAFRRRRWAPIEASIKYFIIAEVGTASLLYAMSLLYGMTGTLNFAQLATSMRQVSPNPWVYLTIALIIVGFGVEGTIVPFHTWLPDAHPEAPSSISALLSGALVKVGIYCICRVLFLLFLPAQIHWNVVLAIFAVITMTLGNIMALLQDDIKRLFAYSTIAQVGYILIGVAVATQYGVMGALFHIFNDAMMKGLAFMCAGAFIYRTQTRDLKELSGIGRSMPVTGAALLIALLSLLGFPPLAGFVSKYILFTSAIEANMPLLAIAGVLNSAFSAAYYLRMIQILILAQPNGRIAEVKEAPVSMLIPMCAMAFIVVLLGIWPEPIASFANNAAGALLDAPSYIRHAA